MENSEQAQVNAVLEANRVRQLAAEQETKGARSFLKVVWGLMIAAGFVPFIGAFAIGALGIISFFTCIYIGAKGNLSGAVKSVLIGMGCGLVGLGIWAVVNFVLIAMFG